MYNLLTGARAEEKKKRVELSRYPTDSLVVLPGRDRQGVGFNPRYEKSRLYRSSSACLSRCSSC